MVKEAIEALRADPAFMEQVRHWSVLPAREGRYADIPDSLDGRIRSALSKRGIDRLYTHQARAVELAQQGRNFVIVTPTASGKTLSYNLPVLQAILENPDTRALYLFPTKALSQDQQAELNMTVGDGGLPVAVVTFDGDTARDIRSAAKTRGQIVISNPDMLHTGILPNHTRWNQFFRNLRYVVVDEIHTYRGIFGSHVTNVIRRLKRVLRFYGSNPQFIFCSATIGNPRELAERILEEDIELIDLNGAPQGERHLVLYNPPYVDRTQGIRRGVVHSARRLARTFIERGVKTIVFARSRQRTELIAEYLRRDFANVYTDNRRVRIEAYRGGYLPNERREIERGLRDGTIAGVVSTNALELGIDIGDLDAAILGGFPGSVASTLQQAGRAGRRRSVSIAVLVASSSPLDQFMVEQPDYFLEQNPESAFVNPDNPYVLYDQLKCAVFELPFAAVEGFPGDVSEYLSVLEENGVIRLSGDRYHWADQSYPAEGVSLRSATGDNVVIVDTTGGGQRVIGEMDRPSAKELLFTNAIYLHRASQYVVTELDIDNRRCLVERSDADYFTDSLLKIDVKVLLEDERRDRVGASFVIGDVLVRSVAAKFKKIRFSSHENVGYGNIDLPEEQMHTRALIVLLPPESRAAAALESLEAAARPLALQRLARLLRNVAPAFLMCSPADMGVYAAIRDGHFGEPAIYIYDRYPGGSGVAETFAERFGHVFDAARGRIASCPCDSGCPSCVGPLDAAEGYSGSPKAAVRHLIDRWPAG